MEVIAWEEDVREMACEMSCLSFACMAWNRHVNKLVYIQCNGALHTSKASINREDTALEGAPRLCCAEMRFIRSEIC
jgi:hypothetical protein